MSVQSTAREEVQPQTPDREKYQYQERERCVSGKNLLKLDLNQHRDKHRGEDQHLVSEKLLALRIIYFYSKI